MKRATAAKQAQLAAAELAALPEKVSSSGYTDQANSKWNFMSHIWGALLRRLQLTVQNVDISFEVGSSILYWNVRSMAKKIKNPVVHSTRQHLGMGDSLLGFK